MSKNVKFPQGKEIQDAEVVKSKFDPQVKYEWNKDEKVVISGEQYGYIRSVLESHLTSEEGQRTLATMEAFKMVQQILVENVETGKFRAVEEEKEG